MFFPPANGRHTARAEREQRRAARARQGQGVRHHKAAIPRTNAINLVSVGRRTGAEVASQGGPERPRRNNNSWVNECSIKAGALRRHFTTGSWPHESTTWSRRTTSAFSHEAARARPCTFHLPRPHSLLTAEGSAQVAAAPRWLGFSFRENTRRRIEEKTRWAD